MLDSCSEPMVDRRRFLLHSGGGIGAWAALSLLPQRSSHAAVLPPDFAPRAKRVIWLFMHGGPSQVDLLDPKPALERYAGQGVPERFGSIMTRRNVAQNPLLPAIAPFDRCGQSGLEISSLLPHIGRHADELCVVRSMHGDSVNHPQSVYQMNTGSILMGRPSVGSWVGYGLGSENENMPAFVVLPDPSGGLKGGPPAWGSGFLPASYQGVTIRPGAHPILNLQPAGDPTEARVRQRLDLLQQLNRRHQASRGSDRLSAAIEGFELAFRMQAEAPELVDLGGETEATERLYGLDQPETREFGTRCLLARRMIERGVRFVQLYSGDTNGWDAHNDVRQNHTVHCRRTDRPVGGLLTDLKRRGLLRDTLVIWGGEFGRMPMSEQGKGRDHNPWGYSLWMAGAGLRGGRAYGATDEIGLRASSDPVHVRQFHATMLHLLGLNHRALSFFHNGLDERLIGPEEVDIVDGIVN